MKKESWLEWFIVVLAFSLLLGITGCSSLSLFPPEENPDAPGDSTPDNQENPIDTGIDFTLPNLDGQDISLSEFRGKPVLVFFFKSYCIYCQEEAPAIQDIYHRHQDELVILGVAANENHGSGSLIASQKDYARMIRNNFVHKHNWTFPVLIDDYGIVQTKYVGVRVPAFLFLNEKGEIQHIERKSISKSKLESLLYQHLL